MFDPFEKRAGSGLDGNDDLGPWPFVALTVLVLIVICAGVGAVVIAQALIHG